MGSDVSKDHFRGLLIADPRLSTVWAAQSSFTQADPQPGIPAAQGNYELGLTSSGVQAASGQLRIRSQRPGHPGKTGSGGFVWQNQGDGNWRGWDVPNLITNYQSVIYTDGSAVTQAATNPSMVCLDDQSIVCAFHRQTSVKHQVRVKIMSSSANTFATGITVYEQSTAPSADLSAGFHPCLVKLPGDRLLLYFLTESNELGNVAAYESTDGGTTWVAASAGVLDAPVSLAAATSGYNLRRIRAAYGGGQVLLLLETISNNTSYTNQNLYTQYASDSAGLVFTKVEEGPNTAGSVDTPQKGLFKFNVHYQAGAFLVSSLHSTFIYISRIGSAFQKLSTAPNSTSANTALPFGTTTATANDGELTATISDSGAVLLYAVGELASKRLGAAAISTDDGSTVEALGLSGLATDGLWWRGDDNTAYPTNYSACFARGRVALMCNHAANPGNEDNSLSFLTLGGSSTVTMPAIQGYNALTRRGGWSENWLPFDLPGATGVWTATATGTQVLADGQLQLTTSTQTAYYSADLDSSVYAAGYIVRASLICATGGNLASDMIAVRLRLADGYDDYDVSVRFTPAGFRVRDNNGSSNVGADVAITLTNEYEFIIAMLGGSTGQNNGQIQIWYRPKNSASDRNWVKSVTGAALANDTSSPASSSNITWGHATGIASSRWTEFHVARADSTGGVNITSQANPADLFAKAYAPSGYRSYVNSGTFITAHDGPSRLGDQYHIDTRYGYPVERMFFSESQTPRVKWRSTNVTENTIALALDNTILGADDSKMGNDVVALTLLGINWKTGVLQGYDSGSASWQSIAAIDAAAGLGSLDWIRDGNTISPGTSTAKAIYLQTNEFEGATFGLQDGSGTELRRITTNTSGEWDGTAATSTKTPQIILSGATASDKASGALGYIMAPNVTIVAKLNGSKYAAYRLKITAQSTVEGYFTVGTAILGWVEAFGRQYSRGRIIETTANTSIVARTDGTTTSNNFGPSQRAVSFAWTDGVDVSTVQGSTPDPDYIKGHTAGGALPIATTGEAPYQMEGIVNMLDGPDKAVVYLPSVAKSANPDTLNRRHQFVAGRIMSPARIESVVGNEDVDPGEVFRVASIDITEIV